MANNKDQGRIDYLDFMRIFAFLSVLIGHLFNVKIAALANDPTLHLTLRQIAQLFYDVCFAGAAGVVVFFFTSGYIITHVLQKESTGEFIVRRIFRIYPLYIVAVLSETVVTHTVMNVPLPTIGELIPRLLLVGDFFSTPYALGGVEWTLRVEVLFYVFMAVLKFFGLIDKPRLLPWLLAAATLCLYVAGPFPSWAGWTNGYLNIFGPFLFIGVLVYLVEKNLANRYVCLAVIAGIYLLSLDKTAQYNVTLKESSYALLALVLFLGGWLLRNRIIGNSFTKTLSEMTYAVYLFHLWSWGYLEILVVKVGITFIPAKVQQLILLFVICYFATKTIEKYGIKAGRTLLAKYKNAPARAVTA
ncbi:acyltransferase family protein [Pseudomonas wadenswilerensis]